MRKFKNSFKKWLEFSEAILDPNILNPKVKKNNDYRYLDRNYALTIDEKGNVIKHDYKTEKPYLMLTADKSIELHKLSPQSKDFNQIIKALSVKYPDIYDYPVHHYFQSGHMQAAGDRIRTVGYWISRPEIRLANKLPKYLYHGTATNLWYEGIKNKGLAPRRMTGSIGSYGAQNINSLSQDNLVYIATDPDAATREAAKQAASKYGGNPLIIRVNTTGLNPNYFVPDEDTHAKTAQGSVDIASTLAYQGRIPAGNLEPFLIGQTVTVKGRIKTDWKKFKDVPLTEHPITVMLKNNKIPNYSDPEYYALLDAGVIGKKKVANSNYFGDTKLVILDKNISDEKIRLILKNAGWTQNVKAILSDINYGYRGNLHQLESLTFSKESLDDKLIRMLIDSGLFTSDTYQDKIYLKLRNWNIESYAINLAKLMGKMSFGELSAKIKSFLENSQ